MQEPEVNTLVQRLAREGTLIIYSLLSLFLVIALLSYSPADPGFTSTGSGDQVLNAVGVYGAWLADILLHLLGYLAYGLPALLAYKAYTLFTNAELDLGFSWPMIALKILGVILLMAAACGLASLHFESPAGIPYMPGGVFGSLIADLSMPVLAILGSTLLFFAIFLIGLTITVTISWLGVIDKVGAGTLFLANYTISGIQKWIENKKQEAITRERLEIRKRQLDIHIEKEKKRIPPSIKVPAPKKVVKSSRVEKERQGKLFTTASVKELPAIGLLDGWQETNGSGFSKDSLAAMSKLLELKLKDFGIDIEVTAVNPGPVITRFEVQPAPGVKASRISNLVKDLARSLAVVSVRVVEVIPGKTVIGIEIPNEKREIIQLSQVLSSQDFDRAGSALSMALGHDIVGKPVIVDLGKMPHLLVAGTTGSGKSVGINAMILSLLFN